MTRIANSERAYCASIPIAAFATEAEARAFAAALIRIHPHLAREDGP